MDRAGSARPAGHLKVSAAPVVTLLFGGADAMGVARRTYMGRRKDQDQGKTLKQLMRAGHLAEPPEGTVRRAVALGGRLSARGEGFGAWIIRQLFDSQRVPAPAGVRGGSSERRMLFEIRDPEGGDSRQLDVRVRTETRGTRRVTGQLLPPIAGARVAMGRRSSSVGATGEFEVRGLPGKGAIDLAIAVPGRDEIRLDDVLATTGKDKD